MKKEWKKRVTCLFVLAALVATMVFSTGTKNVAQAKVASKRASVSKEIKKLQKEVKTLQKNATKNKMAIQEKNKKIKNYKNSLKNKVVFKTKKQQMMVGTSGKLGVSWKYTSAYGKKIEKWTSSNKSVATVNQNGVISAKKAGTAKITAVAAISGKKTSVTVQVLEVSRMFSDKEYTYSLAELEEEGYVTEIGLIGSLEDYEYEVSIEDTEVIESVECIDDIAYVSFTGNPGTSKVTVTFPNKKKATCTIEVLGDEEETEEEETFGEEITDEEITDEEITGDDWTWEEITDEEETFEEEITDEEITDEEITDEEITGDDWTWQEVTEEEVTEEVTEEFVDEENINDDNSWEEVNVDDNGDAWIELETEE